MEYRDYYATLGVPRTASQAEIRKAFRRLAREHHPDVNKGDAKAEGRFKEISEAHEVLADPAKRKAYDQLGAEWESYARAGAGAGGTSRGAGFPGGVRFEFNGNPEDLAGFSDFFRTFFAGGASAAPGGTASSRGTTRWRTQAGGAGEVDIEALFGGIGGETGDGHASSGFGSGSARGRRRTGAALRSDATAEATVSLEEVLRGTERVLQVGDRRLEVRIPPGVRDGQRIRLSGKAEGGGDIYVSVHVSRHPVFSRNGADLSRELPLTLGEALLGAQVPVESLSGKRLLLTIPAGTQNGRVFRLAGQGLPRTGKEGAGDLLVRTRVVLPPALDEEGVRLARGLIDHIDQPDPRQVARAAGAASSRTQPAAG
ncbi:J domain-containing protein [soil metagenome]